MYLFWTNTKLLTHGTHLQLTPLDLGSFHSHLALDEQINAFPITFDVISKVQLADKKIQQCITNNDPDFETRIIQ
jgi:hypothetical protein